MSNKELLRAGFRYKVRLRQVKHTPKNVSEMICRTREDVDRLLDLLDLDESQRGSCYYVTPIPIK